MRQNAGYIPISLTKTTVELASMSSFLEDLISNGKMKAKNTNKIKGVTREAKKRVNNASRAQHNDFVTIFQVRISNLPFLHHPLLINHYEYDQIHH